MKIQFEHLLSVFMSRFSSVLIFVLLLLLPLTSYAQKELDYYDLYDQGKLSYDQLYGYMKRGEVDYWLLMDLYNDGLLDYQQLTDLLKSRRIEYGELAAMAEEKYIPLSALEKLVQDGTIDGEAMRHNLEAVGIVFVIPSDAPASKPANNTSSLLQLSPEIRSLAQKKLTDAQQDEGLENWISEYWVQFLALLVGLIGVFLAVSGYSIAASKKKKSISTLINEIDDTFESFKWKSKRCEAELYRLQDVMDEKLKGGKLDESAYHLLVNRIEKYLKEVQDVHDPLRGGEEKK